MEKRTERLLDDLVDVAVDIIEGVNQEEEICKQEKENREIEIEKRKLEEENFYRSYGYYSYQVLKKLGFMFEGSLYSKIKKTDLSKYTKINEGVVELDIFNMTKDFNASSLQIRKALILVLGESELNDFVLGIICQNKISIKDISDFLISTVLFRRHSLLSRR